MKENQKEFLKNGADRQRFETNYRRFSLISMNRNVR